MIESNLRLVVKIARRYLNRGLSLLDLIEAESSEIAESTGSFRLDIERLMILNEGLSSVDAPAAADSETAVVDMLSAETRQNPRSHVQASEMRARMECWLQQLSEKQREIICRRFGLNGFDTDTLENVGVEVGLTRERVRQIQIEALQQLKILIRREGLNCELLGEAV